VVFRNLNIRGADNRIVTTLQSGAGYTFAISYQKRAPATQVRDAVASIALTDDLGNCVILFRSTFSHDRLHLASDTGEITCCVPDLPLAPGRYGVDVFLSHADSEILDWVERAAEVVVEGGDYFGTGSSGIPSICRVLTRAHWTAT
jgi:lipopolysaccharide transport system ATP-binding protein